MRSSTVALLVGCMLLMALAPASATFSVRRLIGLEDAHSSSSGAVAPAALDLSRLGSFMQSLVTGETPATKAKTTSAKPAEAPRRKRSEYESEEEEERSYKKEHEEPKYEKPKGPKKDEPKKDEGKKGEWGLNKHMCKQVLLEEEDAPIEFIAGEDRATITTLQGTCANHKHPLPTLGGGCVVECENELDLLKINALGSHSLAAPAHFKPVPGYYPVSCSFRTDAALTGACKVVMKVACCSNKDLDKKPEGKGKGKKPEDAKVSIAAGMVGANPTATYDREKEYERRGYRGEYREEEEHEPKYEEHEEHKKEDKKTPEPELVESEDDYLVIIKADTKHIKAPKQAPKTEEKPAAPKPEEKPAAPKPEDKPAAPKPEEKPEEKPAAPKPEEKPQAPHKPEEEEEEEEEHSRYPKREGPKHGEGRERKHPHYPGPEEEEEEYERRRYEKEYHGPSRFVPVQYGGEYYPHHDRRRA